MVEDPLLTEYLAIAENTAKLSDRRQTVSDLFLGVNSLFLAAAGFVAWSEKLASWWAVGIVVAITVITIIMNSIWYRLIGRYRTLISLRIRYLEALEVALQESGTFGEVVLSSEDDKEKHAVLRGIYLIEKKTDLYSKGAKMGFYRLERGLVWVFIFASIALAVASSVLTYLVTAQILSPSLIALP